MNLIELIQQNWALILAFISVSIQVAQVIVNTTPSPKDNAVLAKIIAFLQLIRLYPKNQ